MPSAWDYGAFSGLATASMIIVFKRAPLKQADRGHLLARARAGSHLLGVDLVEFGVVEQQTAPLRQAGDVAIAVLPADIVSRIDLPGVEPLRRIVVHAANIEHQRAFYRGKLFGVMSRKALVSSMICTSVQLSENIGCSWRESSSS
jgi:hypothetical protein